MTITLPPALDALVVRKMATGLYADVSDVVRDALRQMEARESAMTWLLLQPIPTAGDTPIPTSAK